MSWIGTGGGAGGPLAYRAQPEAPCGYLCLCLRRYVGTCACA